RRRLVQSSKGGAFTRGGPFLEISPAATPPWGKLGRSCGKALQIEAPASSSLDAKKDPRTRKNLQRWTCVLTARRAHGRMARPVDEKGRTRYVGHHVATGHGRSERRRAVRLGEQ